MVTSSSALLVMMIPCASDVIGLATVTNHLNKRIWIEVAHECIDPLGTPLPICWDTAAEISQGDGVLAAGFVLADAAVDQVAECWHDGHCLADGLGGLDILTVGAVGLLLLL